MRATGSNVRPPRLEIVAGIAAVNKTSRLIGLYRATLRETQAQGRLGATLWLSPTHRACRQIVEWLCESTLPVVFEPNVLTFDRFAERLLQTVGHGGRPLSAVMQRVLLRNVTSRLRAAGRLGHFAAIAETPGFLDLATGLIAELKRGEIWPEDFREACARRGVSQRDRDLVDLYAAYQSALVRQQVYDSEGRFWSARDELQRGSWGVFGDLALVVIDGFTDFTPTQQQMIGLLAQRVPRVFLTLPLEDSGARPDLFAKSSEMLRLLEQEMEILLHHTAGTTGAAIPVNLGRPKEGAQRPFEAHGPVDDVPHGAAQLPAGIRRIADALFTNPRGLAPRDDAEGVEIAALAGEAGEANWVAARVKRWLLTGVPPDEIVLAHRDLDIAYQRLTETFEASGIPFACEIAPPLRRQPLVKALVNLLQLEALNWPFSRLMGLLNSSLFRPDWREWRDGAAARDVARALRRMRLTEGREWILKRLRSAHDAMASAAAPGESSQPDRAPRDVGRALKFLERLSQALAPLRQRHDLAGWTRLVGGLFSEFRLELGLEAGDGRRVRDALIAALNDGARAERLADTTPLPVSLHDFLPLLLDLIQHAILSPDVPEEGRVRLLRAEQVRNLDVPYLILTGLSEHSFPRCGGDDCLLTESERQEFNRQGLNLTHRARRSQEEMLLFYGIVTRARRQLVLTYPVVSGDGAPLSSSPYLTAVRELFRPGALPTHNEDLLYPIPPTDRLLSWSDARIRGMHDALENRPGLLRAVCDNREAEAAARSALAAAEMNGFRFQTRGFTNFEGMLNNPHNLATVARRFSPEREFSATQFEAYAECPFRFLAEHLCGVTPLETTGLESDYGQRGTVVHGVLAALHRGLTADASGQVPAQEWLVERFRNLVSEHLRADTAHSELDAALALIEQRLLNEWGEAYARQCEQYLAMQPRQATIALQPARLETGFGAKSAESAVGLSSAAPALVVGRGDRLVRIGGRIDRIDVGQLNGRTVFTVIDYKTGRPLPFSEEDLSAGRRLQLALYALAVCRLEQLAGPGAVLFQMGYWHIKEQGFTPALRLAGREKNSQLEPVAEGAWRAIEALLDEVVPRLVGEMRAGHFPVFNSDDHCTAFCPHHASCRVGQIRALPDEMQKRWSINPQ
ncbi:MAG: PD-(D/E)XK nuclease family protein [Planctomycetaceae bacterium]